MYPKKQTKPRRKAHKASILQAKDGTCYLCAREGNLAKQTVQEHHIFGGANRQISEAEGLKVYLCVRHHTEGKDAVHRNAEAMNRLRQEGQRAYEQTHTRQQFMAKFGRNYLEED